ncbi:MAG: acyl-CoA desaturase, partial [Bacteroidota bacterium]
MKKRVEDYFNETGKVRKANNLLMFKVVFYLATYFGALALLVAGGFPIAVQYGLWVIIGLFGAFIGLGVCHDAIHGSLFKSKAWNKALGYMFNVIGANAYIWEIMHNKVHHSFTNIDGHDADLEAVPFLRMSPHKPRKPIHRIQHWLALPVYGLASLSWVFVKDYVKFTKGEIGSLKIKHHPREEWIKLFVGKAVYYSLFIVLPFTFAAAPWYHILLGFLAMHYAQGITLAVIFMLAHIVEEIHYPLPNDDGKIERSWAAHQLYTTANFATGSPVAAFFCCGLNFQVEHHLFPQVSHVHLPAIAKITEAPGAEGQHALHDALGRLRLERQLALRAVGDARPR